MFPTDVTLTGSEFHRSVQQLTKALVPTFVLTLGTKSRLVYFKSTAIKSSCSCFGYIKRHIPANTTKVMNVIQAAMTSCEICCLKLLSKVTPKFRIEMAGVKF